MDPFNIILNVRGEQVDLNIHPQQGGRYKIIYHGGLLGEIFRGNEDEQWEAVRAQELQSGGFPIYQDQETSSYQDILLDQKIVQDIGRLLPE